jgi:2-dehydro-3-deoxyphosphogalactonate aldolase
MQPDSAGSAGTLIAILRGVTPGRALAVARTLYEAGIRAIEVPLNSPEPFASIVALSEGLPDDCQVGAGTVLDAEQVARTHAAGGRLVVAPNCDAAVIRAAIDRGMRVMPGVGTATEAFAALRAGATELKLFPAVSYGPQHLQALRSVLPASVAVYPVGGVAVEALAQWRAAGATGFGFGSELFRPEYELADIARRAARVVAAFQDTYRNR